MIDDPGEIAQLASEFVSSLENLPQEVQHIVKEIEHKDAKVQELVPKLAAREAQVKELLNRRDSSLSESDKIKVEKLTEKIKGDYARADEWNSQKEDLSKTLWRMITGHSKRLEAEIAKISPVLIHQVESSLGSSLSSGAQLLPTSNISSAVLSTLRSPSVERSLELSTPGSNKRKFSGAPLIKGGRQSSADRTMPSPSPLSAAPFSPGGAATGTGPSHKKMKHSGLSVVSKPTLDADGDLEGGINEEKDDRVYCFCQRVSFGEMIGCDSDECKFEWFHLSCVGLQKPLPQVWYCSDCRERMAKEKTERPTKKRKKQAVIDD